MRFRTGCTENIYIYIYIVIRISRRVKSSGNLSREATESGERERKRRRRRNVALSNSACDAHACGKRGWRTEGERTRGMVRSERDRERDVRGRRGTARCL